MKKLTSKALLAVLVLVTGVGAVQSCGDEPKAVPALESAVIRSNMTADEREAIITANKGQLRAVERVIALGLLDPSVKPAFASVVQQATDSAASSYANADWRASLKQINHRYASVGGNMAAEMHQSLMAHGGTSQEAELLNSSIWGININGVLITTTIRLSYRDGMYAVANTHAVATTQLHSFTADPVWVYNGTGFDGGTMSIDSLDQIKTWNVNLLLADGQLSEALYTQPNPGPTSGFCLFCHCHVSETTGWCISLDLRRRCSCAANGIDRPTVSAL